MNYDNLIKLLKLIYSSTKTIWNILRTQNKICLDLDLYLYYNFKCKQVGNTIVSS